MKSLRKVFTNSVIGLICVMLAVFGVGMGLLTWKDGSIFGGVLYVLGGVAVLVPGIVLFRKGDPPEERRGRQKWS